MVLNLELGQIVEVRNRKYVVKEIKPGLFQQDSKFTSEEPHHLVTLSSIEDDGFGEEISVCWEVEPGAKVFSKNLFPSGDEFDSPEDFDSFLNAVRWNIIDSSFSKNLQSPFRSGVILEEYQLEPLIRALEMPRVNLLIADDVGLGKTIEAGLIASELVIRQKARRILIVCPSSLQLQWKEQMREKFGLDFKIVDSELMKNLRRERGIYTNPWTHYPRLITSIDYIKRERPLRLFEDSLRMDEKLLQRDYDLLILDEAHNVAPSGRGKYSLDSQRTKAIKKLEPHFEHKLFLTATPHNGYPESFSSLLELLDNQRFAKGIEIDPKQLRTIMIRRLKAEFKDRTTGSLRFPPREIKELVVEYTQEEKKAHRCLQDYGSSFTANNRPSGRVIFEFVMKLLKKRLFSSPAAFFKTIAKHEKTILEKQTVSNPKGIESRMEELEEEFNDDEEYEQSTETIVEEVSSVLGELSAEQKKYLSEMKSYAESFSSSANRDSKAKVLVKWIRDNLFTNGKWNDRRVLIFTEYRDTQKWLLDIIFPTAQLSEGGRIMSIYGGMKPEEREEIKNAFQAHPSLSPVRILLATDAASEGIDLQNYCNDLIHYEIPWNPNRMEQRNGRLDRHGQKAEVINIYHFVGAGFQKTGNVSQVGELSGDLEFLMRVALKIERIREDLGKMGPILAIQVQEAMRGKRKTLDVVEEGSSSVSRKLLKFEQDIKKQIEESRQKLEESKVNLHISPGEIYKTVDLALRITDKPSLIPINGSPPGDYLYTVPQMAGSWSMAQEGLIHPFEKKIRPITFEPERARGRDDVVLAHLNHPLVRLSLNVLRSEVWSTSDKKRLKRLTFKVLPNSVISEVTILLYSRLLILGSHNQKIQEELLLSGVSLKEGKFKSGLKTEDLERVERTTALPNKPSAKIVQYIQDHWNPGKGEREGIEQLLEKSQDVGVKARSRELEKVLEKRRESEIKNTREILSQLEKKIQSLLKEKEDAQLTLSFTEFESDQYSRDRENLQRRVLMIPAEIEREVQKIQSKYSSQTPRVFPVGVCVYIPQAFNS